MTPTEAANLLDHVKSLWPRCDWEDATKRVFTRAVLPLDAMASGAALDKYRAETAGAFIDVAKAIEAVKSGQPKARGWSGSGMPQEWRTIAIKMGMKDAGIQDVMVNYWRSFEGYWDRETVWRGLVSDLRSVAHLTLDQAAHVSDARIGEAPGVMQQIEADEQATKEMVMRGPEWCYAELRRRGKEASMRWAKCVSQRRREEEEAKAKVRTARLADMTDRAIKLLGRDE